MVKKRKQGLNVGGGPKKSAKQRRTDTRMELQDAGDELLKNGAPAEPASEDPAASSSNSPHEEFGRIFRLGPSKFVGHRPGQLFDTSAGADVVDEVDSDEEDVGTPAEEPKKNLRAQCGESKVGGELKGEVISPMSDEEDGTIAPAAGPKVPINFSRNMASAAGAVGTFL